MDASHKTGCPRYSEKLLRLCKFAEEMNASHNVKVQSDIMKRYLFSEEESVIRGCVIKTLEKDDKHGVYRVLISTHEAGVTREIKVLGSSNYYSLFLE